MKTTFSTVTHKVTLETHPKHLPVVYYMDNQTGEVLIDALSMAQSLGFSSFSEMMDHKGVAGVINEHAERHGWPFQETIVSEASLN